MITLSFLFFNCIWSNVYLNNPVSDINVDMYSSFEYKVPNNVFGNTGNGRTLISIEPNDWIKTTYESPEFVGEYYMSRGDGIQCGTNHIYLSGTYNFLIIDVTDPAKLFVSGQLGFDGPRGRLDVFGDLALISSGPDSYDNGLYIVDISDKTNPVLLKKLGASDGICETYEKHAFLRDNILYYADESLTGCSKPIGLKTYDVTDPKFPIFLDVYGTTSRAYDVTVQGDYAYVLTYNDDLLILNIQNPSNIIFAGKKDDMIGTQCKYLTVKGNYAYIICGLTGGLETVDVSNPAAPSLTDHKAGDGSADFITIIGDYLYLSDYGYPGIRIYDIGTDPAHPALVVSSWGTNEMVEICKIGNIAYITAFFSGIYVADFSVLTSPVIISNQFNEILATSLRVAGKNLFLETRVFGLGMISIEDITHPTKISMSQTAKVYNNGDLDVISDGDGKYAFYAANGQGLKIIDFSTGVLDAPNVGSYDTAGNAIGVSVQDDGEYAYVADNSGGMLIFDIRVISTPLLVGSVPDTTSKVDIDGEDFAYIIDTSGKTFKIVNCSDKSSPVVIGNLGSLTGPEDVFVFKNYVYIADGVNGLRVVDCSDKTDPKLVGSVDTQHAFRVIVINDYTLYLGDKDSGVLIIDISVKSQPVILLESSIPLSGMKGIFGEDNYIYAADIGTNHGSVRWYRTSLKLEGNPSSWKRFCGDTVVKIKGVDANSKTVVYSSFVLSRDGYCNGHGICLDNYECSCEKGYEGNNCEIWKCDGYDFTQTNLACSNHGTCISPDSCKCHPTWYGEKCKSNLLYATVMAPGLVIMSSFGFLFLAGVCVCILLSSCFGVFLFCLVLSACCAIVLKQTKGIKKFNKLRNFNLLLKEQELDDDITIAHLRINKSIFEIPLEEIEILKILGEGGSNSIVYKSKWKGQIVAFKCFKTRCICQNQDNFDEFEKEVHILGSVSHPNILQFLGCCLKPPRIGILMEYCKNGDLNQFLKIKQFENIQNKNEQQQQHSYPIEEKIRMSFEIISSLDYLHSRRIIHRDMKLENVLVDSNEKTKIMDFGLSKMISKVSNNAPKTKRIGTSIYMAPEIVISDSNYDGKCDVFSFSIMLFIIFTENFKPYSSLVSDDNMVHIEMTVSNNPDFRPDLEELRNCFSKVEEHHGWLVDIVKKCWNHDSSERYSFSELSDIFTRKKEEEQQKKEKEGENNSNSFLDSLFSDRSNSYSSSTSQKKEKIEEEEEEEEVIIPISVILEEEEEDNDSEEELLVLLENEKGKKFVLDNDISVLKQNLEEKRNQVKILVEKQQNYKKSSQRSYRNKPSPPLPIHRKEKKNVVVVEKKRKIPPPIPPKRDFSFTDF